MSHQLAYLIARQRTAELQHAAARQRLAREASPPASAGRYPAGDHQPGHPSRPPATRQSHT